MYIVLYDFKVKPNQAENFIEAWKGLTRLIYEYEGSLGSRLHKKEDLHYIAYAQWPNKSHFNDAGGKLPKAAEIYRDSMKQACSKIEILDKLEVVEDLLAKELK